MIGSIGIPELVIIILVLSIFLVPAVLVLNSRRTSGSKKLGWFLITIFLSWLGYGFFLVFTNKNKITSCV